MNNIVDLRGVIIMEIERNFGAILKELRLKSNLTQKQLANQIGVTKSVVSFYELRTRTPSPDVLTKLAAVFHVSTDFLLGIDNIPRVDVSGLTENDIALVSAMVNTLREKNKGIK